MCNVCNASGCWPTKSRCFRCGHARDARNNVCASGSSPSAGREKPHPGRAPRAKAAPVNPTFRAPRVIPPKNSTSPAAATSPPVAPQAQVAPDVLVAALRALGVGENLLTQIQTSIKPPAPKVRKLKLKSWNGPKIITARNWRCVSRTVNRGQENWLLFRKNIGPSRMESSRRIQLLLLR